MDNGHDSDHGHGHGLKAPFRAAKKPQRPVERVETQENDECPNHLWLKLINSNSIQSLKFKKTAEPVCPV